MTTSTAPEALLFFGGPIRTMTVERPVVEALGVVGDRIVAAGSRSEVEAVLGGFPGRRPRPVDLDGALLLPGFVDCHTHLGGFALRMNFVDLDGAASLEEALARVRDFAARVGPGRWVRGGGWNKNLWPGGRFPSRLDLDRVVPSSPVALSSKDGHSWWLNTEALRRAGIGRDTPDPPGGEIERDASGEPTGILKETAGGLVTAALEQPSTEEYAALMGRAMAAANEKGLVGIHDMEGRESLRAFQALLAAGGLALRVWMYLPGELLPSLGDLGLESGFGGPWLRIAGVKAFLDGALGSQTADMLEPYVGSGARGIETMTTEAFTDLVGRASAARLAVAVHAIGDRANRKALDAFEAHAATWRKAGLRHRIEHVQLLHPDDLPRLGRLGVVASMQPIHAPSDRDMADRYWGPDRVRTAYAWRSLVRTGARLAFGSDVPVESCDPLKGLYAAVTRRHPDEPGREPWHAEEALTPYEAVKAYTVGAAWAVGAEAERGTLEPGKLADLVILSEDFLAVPGGDPPAAPGGDSLGAPGGGLPAGPDGEWAGTVLLRTQVVATIVGGRFVYGAL